MDPDAAANRIALALRDGDLEEIANATRDLADWIERGGFEPTRISIVLVLREVQRRAERDGAIRPNYVPLHPSRPARYGLE